MSTWVTLTLVALLFFGITGGTQKVSTNNISFSLSFVYFAAGIVLVSLVVWLLAPVEKSRLNVGNVSLAALGGFLNALGAFTSFIALEKGGKASVVIPIVNLYPLVTAVGAFLFLGESLAARQVWGLMLALIAVVLLSRESDTPVAANVRA
jgi:drug/metabolite transporter (DMT)-like permease